MNERSKPDVDLLALAGFAKTSLRDVDQNSTGGNNRADKLDIRKIAGLETSTNSIKGLGILKGLDFVDMPKSRPIGRVDMDGNELPPLPPKTMPEFIPVPEDLREFVLAPAQDLDPHHYPHDQRRTTPEKLPDLSADGFDLFQHAIVKQILDDLDRTIKTMEGSLDSLKEKREHIVALIVGEKK